MRRFNTNIEDAQWTKLNELAKAEGVSAGVLLRNFLDFGLKLHDPNSKLTEALNEARRTFDDADCTERALERALIHWLHNRQENSIRGSQRRQEETAVAILAIVTQTDARIAAVEANTLSLLRKNEEKL